MQILKKRFSSDENIYLELLKLKNIRIEQVEILSYIIRGILQKIAKRLKIAEIEVRNNLTFLAVNTLTDLVYKGPLFATDKILFQDSNNELIDLMFEKYKGNPHLETNDVGTLLKLQKFGVKERYALDREDKAIYNSINPFSGNFFNQKEEITKEQEEEIFINKFIRFNQLKPSSKMSLNQWRTYKFRKSEFYTQKVKQQRYLNSLLNKENAGSISQYFNITPDELAFNETQVNNYTRVFIGNYSQERYQNLYSLERVTGNFCIRKTKYPYHLYNLVEIIGNADFKHWDGDAPSLLSIDGNANFSGYTGKVDNLLMIGGNAIFGQSIRSRIEKYYEEDADYSRDLTPKFEYVPYLCQPWVNSAKNLKFIGGNANFSFWSGEASQLSHIGGDAIFNEWSKDAPLLKTIQGNAKFGERKLNLREERYSFYKRNSKFGPWLGSAPRLEFIGGTLFNENWNGELSQYYYNCQHIASLVHGKAELDKLNDSEVEEYNKFIQAELDYEKECEKYLSDDEWYFQGKNAMIIKSTSESLILLSIDRSNITSVVHEIIHEFERLLNANEIIMIEKWCKARSKSKEFSEALAIGAEKYIFESHFDNFNTKLLRLSTWFKETIKNSEDYFNSVPNLNSEVRALYHNIFTFKE